MSTVFSRQLSRIIHEGRFTVAEMADVCGCSERHIYNVAGTDTAVELGLEKAETLSRYLSAHGDTRLALGMLSPDYRIQKLAPGTADGCVKDEVLRAVDAVAGARKAHAARDPSALRACIADLAGVICDLSAEMALLE